MCGICGGTLAPDLILKASGMLHHRGPDTSGHFTDPHITLAHTRLSIIDLSHAADQPMEESEWVLLYNGEIYNYLELREELIALGWHFTTHSDTEVLLKAFIEWGIDCLECFNGDFAFALYNRLTHTLWCARDRVGNKPFYYHLQGGVFAFASELRPLFALFPPSFHTQTLGDALLFSINDHQPQTLYEGILQLPPGHWMQVDLASLSHTIKRWWHPPHREKETRFSAKKAKAYIEELDALLHDAVKLRLRSDVKVASLLSGGIDSALIAHAIHASDPGHTFFSALFPDHPKIDETPHVRMIEAHLGISARVVEPSLKQLKADLPDLVLTQSDLFRSLSVYLQYAIVRDLSQKHKVMLSGQGADELFGGYYHHVSRFIAAHPSALNERIALYGSAAMEEWKLGAKCLLSRRLKLKLLQEDNAASLIKIQAILPDYLPDWGLLMEKFTPSLPEALLQDTTRLNLPQLLRYEDRNAMRFGVENRTPFTDYRLIEFALSLPVCYKVREGYSKWILRQVALRHLTHAIALRLDKIGFDAPDSHWMAGLGFHSTHLVDWRIYLFTLLKESLHA